MLERIRLHTRRGHEGPEQEQRYSSTLSSTSELRGVGGQCHVPAALLWKEVWYPFYRRLGGPQGRSGLMRRICPQGHPLLVLSFILSFLSAVYVCVLCHLFHYNPQHKYPCPQRKWDPQSQQEGEHRPTLYTARTLESVFDPRAVEPLGSLYTDCAIPVRWVRQLEDLIVDEKKILKDKGKAIPLQAQIGPERSRTLRLPGFSDTQHMKVVGPMQWPPLHTPPSGDSWQLFMLEAGSNPGPQCGRQEDPIGNKTRNLPACSAVPQPAALPHTGTLKWILNKKFGMLQTGLLGSGQEFLARFVNSTIKLQVLSSAAA